MRPSNILYTSQSVDSLLNLKLDHEWNVTANYVTV